MWNINNQLYRPKHIKLRMRIKLLNKVAHIIRLPKTPNHPLPIPKQPLHQLPQDTPGRNLPKQLIHILNQIFLQQLC